MSETVLQTAFGNLQLLVPFCVIGEGDGLPLPYYATKQAAGADVYAAISQDSPIILAPMQRVLVPLGFALALPQGWEAQIRPRSGLALRYGVTILNSPGTIDADYRGEIKALMINLGDTTFKIERGMRIAQMVLAPAPQMTSYHVSTLPDTDRGEGGYGSTGEC